MHYMAAEINLIFLFDIILYTSSGVVSIPQCLLKDEVFENKYMF